MKKNSSSSLWLYGRHACTAALQNPDRHVLRALLTKNALDEMKPLLGKTSCNIVEVKQLDKILPPDAVHQGIALEVATLPQPELEDVIESGKMVVLLDQVTDPHNVGAILRSAAAFDAGAVIVHDRNAPRESGVMAKSASGAVDLVPLVSVTNLSNAIETLQQAGYWCIGLDGHTNTTLSSIAFSPKTALVMGAEGKGLRRLTAERCDQLAKLPMHPQMESLNVSNAAAIALYTIFTKLN